MSSLLALHSPWKRPARNARSTAFVLWIVDRLRAPIGAFGVDFPMLRLVLENRLRNGDPNLALRKTREPAIGSGTLVAAALSASVGLLPAMIALTTHESRLWMLAGQALWGFVIASMTLSHFANVLIDSSDVAVLASRPIDDRTILAARLVQVLVELTVLTAAAAALPAIAGAFAFDPLASLVAYPLATACTTMLVLGTVTLAFAVALRVAGPQRFQRVTFWIQTTAAIVIVLVPQLAPRLVSDTGAIEWLEAHPSFAVLVPPLHGHGLYQVLAGTAQRSDWLLAAFAIALPLVLALLTLHFASRNLVAAIADPGSISSPKPRGFSQGWLARLGPRLCTTSEARAAFGFTLSMSRRERAFVRGVLPQAAMVVAMAVVMMLPRHGKPASLEFAPIGLYYALLICVTACEASRMSEHAKASWWFDALPFARRKLLFEGAAKALLVGIVGPALAALALVVLVVLGWSSAGEILFAVVAVSGVSCWLAWWFVNEVPFTQPMVIQASGMKLLRILAVALVMGAMVGLHFVLRMHPLMLAGGGVLFAIVAALGWRRLASPRSPARGW